jgi:hypothetical protein
LSDGLFLVQLTVSQRMALIDLLIEHQMEPGCSREFVDVARGKTTRHGELLLLLDRALWFPKGNVFGAERREPKLINLPAENPETLKS